MLHRDVVPPLTQSALLDVDKSDFSAAKRSNRASGHAHNLLTLTLSRVGM